MSINKEKRDENFRFSKISQNSVALPHNITHYFLFSLSDFVKPIHILNRHKMFFLVIPDSKMNNKGIKSYEHK